MNNLSMIYRISETIDELREELSKAAIKRDYTKYEQIMTLLASFKRVKSYYSEKSHEDNHSCQPTPDQTQPQAQHQGSSADS